MSKAYQRIIREELDKERKYNLFQENLHPENLSLKDSKVVQCNFAQAKKIILKYEWLRSMPHRFGYRVSHGILFENIMGGVLVYAQPQVRSENLFGKDYGSKSIIQLSRGACANWTPKNTASHLLAKSLKILKKEGIVAVVAYCTPEAGEIGTIYQASNFIYYGKTTPSKEYFLDSRWMGERSFAHKKKWLKRQPKYLKDIYKKSFEYLPTREVLPRLKYIKILNRVAEKTFKHEKLQYPKRIAD